MSPGLRVPGGAGWLTDSSQHRPFEKSGPDGGWVLRGTGAELGGFHQRQHDEIYEPTTADTISNARPGHWREGCEVGPGDGGAGGPVVFVFEGGADAGGFRAGGAPGLGKCDPSGGRVGVEVGKRRG